MKYISIVLCAVLILPMFFSCASSPAEPLPPDTEGQIIVNKGTWLHDGYELADGQELSNKQLNQLLLEVPQNETIVRNSKIMNGVKWTMVGLLLASFITNATYQIGGGDFPHTDAVLTATYWTSFATVFGSILTGSMTTSLRQKAVDNYNLYIQGIPIK